MLTSAPYRIWTIKEAKNGGYAQMELHTSRLKLLLELVDDIRGKARWLRSLTPDRVIMLGRYLDPYLSVLRYSFIIVNQEDDFEYMERSLGSRYCMWRRDLTCDN